jgi:hypothetical protein
MNRRFGNLASLLGMLAFVGVSNGCYPSIPSVPDPVDAYSWCVSADPAEGWRIDEETPISITHPDSGLWMRACKCFCPVEHEIMVQGANGWLTPGSPDDDFYEYEVGLLRASAELACLERVVELEVELGTLIEFDAPGTVSCQDAVADEEPFSSNECILNEAICPPGAGTGTGTEDGGIPGTSGETGADGSTGTEDGTGDTGSSGSSGSGSSGSGSSGDDDNSGSGSDGGAGVYGIDAWSVVIDCPTRERCDVDAAFVERLLADLSLLYQDHIGVRPGVSRLGHHGFMLVELGADSFPAALGLEPGDVLWRVNGIELQTLGDVGHAFEVLNQATVLKAEIDRGLVTITRMYRIVERGQP